MSETITKINLTDKHLEIIDGVYQDFEVSGKKYTVNSWASYMPPKRFLASQRWGLVSAYGKSFQEMFDDLTELEALHRQSYVEREKSYDVGLKIADMKNGIINFGDKRYHACYMLACVYITREDEDLMEFNEDFQEKKIVELIESGIDSRDFFSFALRTVNGFQSAYESTLKLISEVMKQEQGA